MTPLETIKKLLRLNKSSNPHEAALAMQKAMEIAAKNRIDLASVSSDETDQRRILSHLEILGDKKICCERRYAVAICNSYFNVSIVISPGIYRPGKITMVGTHSDLEIANYVYGFLIQHFRYCWNNKSGRFRDRKGYLYGMYVGLVSKLEELEAARTPGEVSAKENELTTSRQAYVDKLFPSTTNMASTSPNFSKAAGAGYYEGRNTDIRSGLKGESSKPLAITNS